MNFKDAQLVELALIGYVELQHFSGPSHLMCVNLNALDGAGEQGKHKLTSSVAKINLVIRVSR